MKYFLTILICFCAINTFSQESNIDSVSIAFKAKLFTISEYGTSNKRQILEDIEKQELVFLNTMYEHFLFMKIQFSQPYRFAQDHTRTLYRDCNYFMAFSINDSRYYRLGGFDTVDIDVFFKDLELKEGLIIKDHEEGGNEIAEIDIHCLYAYYKMKKRTRIKKGFKCLENCSDNTKTKIIEY